MLKKTLRGFDDGLLLLGLNDGKLLVFTDGLLLDGYALKIKSAVRVFAVWLVVLT